jgi:hypothetical protein
MSDTMNRANATHDGERYGLVVLVAWAFMLGTIFGFVSERFLQPARRNP